MVNNTLSPKYERGCSGFMYKQNSAALSQIGNRNPAKFFVLVISILALIVFIGTVVYGTDESNGVGAEFTVDGLNYTVTSDNPATVEVTGPADKSTTSIIIPSSVTYSAIDFSVTSVAGSAFSNCTSAKTITIPSSVTSIGSYAFAYCRAATQLNYDVPENTNTSANYMFAEIGSSSTGVEVIFGENVRKVPSAMFIHPQSLNSKNNRVNSVVFEGPVTHIGASAFSKCYSLQEITIPESVVEIGNNAFYSCNSLKTVYVNAKHLNDYSGSSGLFTYDGLDLSTSSITLVFGEGVERIPANFATGSYSKVGTIVISSTVESIGAGAFNGNKRLGQVTMYSAPEIEGTCFSTGNSISIGKITVNSICESGFLSKYCGSYTNITYKQIPHVEINMMDMVPDPVPESWYLHNGSLLKYYPEGSEITLPDIHVTGYTFKGWNTVPETTMGTTTQIYNSLWEINHVTISFDSNGGTAVDSIYADYGQPISFQPPTKTGYWLTGWTPALPSTMPEYDTTYKANWTLQKHTVHYDTQGGTAIADAEKYYGETIPLPVTSRTGYDFQKWTLTPSGTTMGESDVTATAEWKIRVLTLTFDSNGGSSVPSITAEYGTPISVSNPTLTGYAFTGWSPALPATVPEDNQTYTAQWELQKHTVTYNSNGGTSVAAKTLEYGQTIPLPTVTRTGYDFVNWTLTPSGSTMGESDVTATATWKIKIVTLTFNSKGGSLVPSITAEYGTPISVSNPTLTGFAFTGWSPALPSTMPESNQTYTAQWEKQKHMVIYNSNGGTSVASKMLEYGQTIPLPTITRAGYDFMGWTLNPSGSTMGEKNVTATASWSAKTVTISFNTSGGTSIDPITKKVGETVYVSPPTKSGYTFQGWSPSFNNTMPTKNTTYTAIWKQNSSSSGTSGGSSTTNSTGTCTIHLMTQTYTEDGAINLLPGGSVKGAGTYSKGETITISAIPSFGWKFDKWSDGNTSAEREITVSSDKTLTAIFVENPNESTENVLATAGFLIVLGGVGIVAFGALVLYALFRRK